MSIICNELAKNGTEWNTDPLTYEGRYYVIGTDNATDVDGAVKVTAPLTMTYLSTSQVLFRQSIKVNRETNTPDGAYWTASVSYAISEVPWSFDTTGGTTHVTQSLSTISKYGSDTFPTAPDCGGGIGYDPSNQSFSGVDIITPVFNWQETHTYSLTDAIQIGTRGTLNWSLIMTWYNMTGKINGSAWRTFAAGEVQFQGVCGGRQKNDNEADVVFKFSASPTLTGVSIPGINGNITKAGWDYLWCIYSQTTSENMLVKQPIAAYVDRVYPTGDFSSLGIG